VTRRPVPREAQRPAPPAALVEDIFGMRFAPAPDLGAWVQATFIDEAGRLCNEDHAHLRDATVGWLWASSGFVKQGRRVLGQAEMPMFRCGPWQKARQEQQLAEWFGELPDFVITLDAFHCAQADDTEFCALVEHELYHCGHALDEFGVPKFTRTGRPVFAIRGHDVEEFVGVVRRYGVGHPDGYLADLIRAAAKGPQIAPLAVAGVCGTCAA
jgi:Putative phage metallopeptidase